MKIIADYELCEANAVCVDCCDAVFEVNDRDELIVHEEHVTEALRDQLEQAVRRCPRQALRLEG